MEFTKRTVKSRPGLSQERALQSLQAHPNFVTGTRISSVRRRGEEWVVEMLEPKTAGPFPPGGGDDEGGGPPKPAFPDDGGGDDSGSDGPPDSPDDGGDEGDGPPKEEGEDKADKKGGDAQVVHLLQQILDALGGGAPDDGLGGPDDLGPDGGGPPGPPSPHGGPPPPGAGAPPHGGRPMKPGEAPPGSTPIGAPAFASTRQANPGMAPVPQAGGPGVDPTGGAATCPQCGGPQPCAIHGGAPAAAPMGAPVARTATFVASRPANVNIRTAKAELDREYGPHGYKVKQIKRDGNTLRALLSRR